MTNNHIPSPEKGRRNRLFMHVGQRQRMSFRMVVLTASSIMLMFGGGLYLYFQFGKSEKAYAATMTAVSNGNWSSASTWSANRVPADYDTLTIPAGKTVTVDIVTVQYINMKIAVNGKLYFQGGKKIRMCDGVVVISSTGVLSGENNGSKLDICDNPVWTGVDDLYGPVTLTYSGTLPIELISFDAKADGNEVKLSWKTATEINNDYFTIERSSNGKDFTPVVRVNGAGNSTTKRSYSAIDKEPLAGTSYYRLKQTDYDGQYTYSSIRTIRNSNSDSPGSDVSLTIETVYPNPFGDHFTIKYNTDTEAPLTFTLAGSDGRLYATQKLQAGQGSNDYAFENGDHLTPGNYVVTLASDQGMVSKMVVKR